MFDCQKTKGREAMSQPGCKLAKYLETKEVKSLFFFIVGLDNRIFLNNCFVRT